MSETVHLGLGGNLGDREAYLRAGLQNLACLGGVVVGAVSSLYQTRPIGPQDQGLFLNAAAEVSVDGRPEEFLDQVLSLEAELGRVRERRWGPRVIDIDLLLWNGLVMETERLTIPHPEMARRQFVLAPLAEIAPQAEHPVLKMSVLEMLAACPDQGVDVFKKGPAWFDS